LPTNLQKDIYIPAGFSHNPISSLMKRSAQRLKVLGFFLPLGATIILGVWGFHLHSEKLGVLDLLYCSLQLFNLNSGAIDGPVPMPLEIARWLAPVTLVGGAIGVARSFFGSKLDHWIARGLHGHHIICGLGWRGYTLAMDLLAGGERVVVLDPSPDGGSLESFKKRGGIHFPIDESHPAALNSAGIEGAATFTALTPNDSLNLATVLTMELKEATVRRRSSLKIFAHIGSVAYRDSLDRSSLLGAMPHGLASVRSFNVHANLARLLFENFPLETAGHEDGAVNIDRQIHLILGDLGEEASALAVHSARIGHYLGCRKVHLHVIASGAINAVNALKVAYPNFDLCCASIQGSNTETAPEFGHFVAAIIRSRPNDCFTVFPSFAVSASNLETTLRVHEAVPACYSFRMPIPRGMQELLAPVIAQNPLLASRIIPFPSLAQYCGKEAVFGEKLDEVAKAIHHNWYSQTSGLIASAKAQRNFDKVRELEAKPTYKPWNTSTEEQKDANRSQADHFHIKFRAAGLNPSTITKSIWLDWCKANEEALEHLARVEHERWAAHLWLAGWVKGPRKDDKKTHDNLVPYDELDNDTKDYDRATLQGLSHYLPA